MTTKSPIRNVKSRLATSASIHNPTGHASETKSSRICIKKPLSSASFLSNTSSTTGFGNQLKKRTLQLNQFFQSKIKSSHSCEHTNGLQPTEHSPSPPLVFYAIAPASPDSTDPDPSDKVQLIRRSLLIIPSCSTS